MDKPTNPPGLAYVVIANHHDVCFSAPTFERAAERMTALVRGNINSPEPAISYHIVAVEAD